MISIQYVLYIWLTKKLTISKSPFSLWSILNRIEVIRKGGGGEVKSKETNKINLKIKFDGGGGGGVGTANKYECHAIQKSK